MNFYEPDKDASHLAYDSNKKFYFKVFGERNTGTNFVSQLISKNTDLYGLQHGSNIVPEKRFEAFLNNSNNIKEYPPELLELVLDRLIDQQRKDEYPYNFGWKHARVDINKLSSSPRFNHTIFIFLIRNPWRFVSALYRRPYNLFPKPTGSLYEFVETSFLANERDCLPRNFVDSPVEFWNIKVKSYFECHAVMTNSIICSYEEIVKNPGLFLQSLDAYCNVSHDYSIPDESTKGDFKTFRDYQYETAVYDPRTELGIDVYQQILIKLDKHLLDNTLYS